MTNRRPGPERLDDDCPELDEAWFARARPARDVLPGLVEPVVAARMLKPRRGRPPVEAPKEHVNIRLDQDIVQSFRNTGAGWQTRMNDALREWLRSHAT